VVSASAGRFVVLTMSAFYGARCSVGGRRGKWRTRDGIGELLADVRSGVLRTMVSWAHRSLKPAKNAMAVKKYDALSGPVGIWSGIRSAFSSTYSATPSAPPTTGRKLPAKPRSTDGPRAADGRGNAKMPF
jgi:hypothetical protein